MSTERQLQLEQAVRRALKELGNGVSTEFLIPSERTKADPGEILEAVENRRRGRQGPDEGTGGAEKRSPHKSNSAIAAVQTIGPA